MTFNVDTTSHATALTNAASLTWSHTCAAGANKLVVLAAGAFSFDVTSVTYNSVSCTAKGSNTSGGMRVSIWELNSPATGSAHNIVVTYGGTNGAIAASAISFINASTTSRTSSSSSGNSTTPNVTVAESATGGIVLSLMMTESSAAISANGTLIWEDEGIDSDAGVSAQRQLGTGINTACGWTIVTSEAWVTIGIVVTGAPPVTPDTISDPLQISSQKSSCFQDSLGNGVWLVGVSGQYDDGWPLMTTAYLDTLAAHRVNWVHWRLGPFIGEAVPPYTDTGGQVYDLTSFNAAYWSNLRSLLTYAKNLGIYVELDIIDGWAMSDMPGEMPWGSGNNSNSIALTDAIVADDPENANQVVEDWIRKVIAETGDFDNVIYQIGNETYDVSGGATLAWEEGVVTIAEDELTIQSDPAHLFSTNSHLTTAEASSKVDYINRHDTDATYGATLNILQSKPTAMNESNDLTVYTAAQFREFLWKSFILGTHWQFYVSNVSSWDEEGFDTIYYFRNFLDVVDFEGLTNVDSVYTGNTGQEYVAFLLTGGAKTINLGGTVKDWTYRWFDPVTGNWETEQTLLDTSGNYEFTAPDTDPWVLHVVATGGLVGPIAVYHYFHHLKG